MSFRFSARFSARISSDEELIDAVRREQSDKVKDILEQTYDEININCRFEDEENATETLLGIACYHQSDTIFSLLLEYGADPNTVVDDSGWTVLHFVCFSRDYEKIKLLLQYKAEVNYNTHGTVTPLHVLIRSNRDEFDQNTLSCLRLLLEHDANVHIPDNFGCTVLYETVKCHGDEHRREAIRLLLSYHANVNLQVRRVYKYEDDMIGDTALHVAVRNNDIDVVKLMLEHSSPDLTLRNGENDTVCDLARKLGYITILKCLQTNKRKQCCKNDCQCAKPIKDEGNDMQCCKTESTHLEPIKEERNDISCCKLTPLEEEEEKEEEEEEENEKEEQEKENNNHCCQKKPIAEEKSDNQCCKNEYIYVKRTNEILSMVAYTKPTKEENNDILTKVATRARMWYQHTMIKCQSCWHNNDVLLTLLLFLYFLGKFLLLMPYVIKLWKDSMETIEFSFIL